jgi:catechol 2,3-dioxygenase-like lactoylglutathione lyase family enzyme
MNFQRLEHINLSCCSLEASQQFYQTLFPDWVVREQGDGWIHLGNNQFYISLFKEPSCTRRNYAPYDSVGFNHVGLVIQDGQAMQATLDQHKIPYQAPNDSPETTFRVYLNDPDGNEIELIEYSNTYALR